MVLIMVLIEVSVNA